MAAAASATRARRDVEHDVGAVDEEAAALLGGGALGGQEGVAVEAALIEQPRTVGEGARAVAQAALTVDPGEISLRHGVRHRTVQERGQSPFLHESDYGVGIDSASRT